MFKLALTLVALAALPAQAETLSAVIGRTGLAATEARLAALPAPNDDERFVLGGVQFLRAIEGTFQTRWAYGLTDRTGLLPLLRLPLDDNPAPKPFEPAVITTLFRDAEAGLARSIASLAPLTGASTVGVEIDLGDLWFDVDASGGRGPGEGLIEILGAARFGDQPTGTPTIRFDTADAAWLAAYGHLLSGVSEMVQAYDPTEPVARILAARQKMAEWGPPNPSLFLGMQGIPDEIDVIAIILASLDQQPDVAGMARARDHFLAMIAENRAFWTRAEAETDADREWLPNGRQTSGLGVTLPPEAALVWQDILTDAEAVLTGEKLIPYWRVGAAGGVNLGRVFTDPRPVDIPGWFQGWAALPYLQSGPLVSLEHWNQFEAMMMGDAMLFALWLN